ncbi:hypothetical protein MSUIS_06000 [Mycoplasma suis KI3806]|uniref:Uncharacterized protein n=1 Tax=Mycoplasma suis (strain KI_3806) TaxID=708248 RepID=F0V212_MYCS3|nr:hypothetical protein [Mycoplasma suis]CBZ40693.1 hypothetical protein MSUIS_06000 [Mycoplasma suis KI3806]
MFLFSKSITLGTLLAGGSGLSAYLIPYKFGSAAAQNPLFSLLNSSVGGANSKEFIENEKEKLKTLDPLLAELNKAVKNSEEFKNLQNDSMKKSFESILEAENKLSELYKKNKEIMDKLSKSLEETIKQYGNKNKVQANILGAKYYKKLFSKLDEFFRSKENALQAVISEINKNENSSNSQETEGSSSNVKGASAEVKRVLSDVEREFLTVNLNIQQKLLKIWISQRDLSNYEINLKLLLFELEETISFLESFSSDLQIDSKETESEINQVINNLNNLKEQLRKTLKNWEELKDKLSYFRNFEGKIKNSVCKNTQFENLEKCSDQLLKVSK